MAYEMDYSVLSEEEDGIPLISKSVPPTCEGFVIAPFSSTSFSSSRSPQTPVLDTIERGQTLGVSATSSSSWQALQSIFLTNDESTGIWEESPQSPLVSTDEDASVPMQPAHWLLREEFAQSIEPMVNIDGLISINSDVFLLPTADSFGMSRDDGIPLSSVSPFSIDESKIAQRNLASFNHDEVEEEILLRNSEEVFCF